jgi:probable addiction module antidote protein
MKGAYAPLDLSSYLDNDEVIAEYLTAAAEDENPAVLMAALGEVAKARGMKQIAEAAGLGRESLYKALVPGANPRFETIRAVLQAMNVGIRITKKARTAGVAAKKPRPPKRITKKAPANPALTTLAAAKKRKLQLQKEAAAKAAKRPVTKRRA